MTPSDRDLVDSLMGLILSVSLFIDLLFEEEINIMLASGDVSVRRLKILSDARRRFAVTAEAMHYALSIGRR